MRRNLKKTICIVMAASLVLSSANISSYTKAAKKVSITKNAKVTNGKTVVVKLKNNKKKVTWKVTKGTKCVKITAKSKTSCTVKALKTGNAIVQATIGKSKYKCSITVVAAKTPEATPVPTEPQESKSPETSATPTETPEITPTSVPEATPDLSDIKTVIYDGTNSEEIKETDKENIPYKVVVKEGVTTIGIAAFEHCQRLRSIEIPNSVTTIQGQVFSGCSELTSIEIPSSVTRIAGGVLVHCDSLKSIKVDADNTVYDSREDCNAIIETKSNKLISGCSNTKIPDSVTGIDSSAFVGCSDLTSIEISEHITMIGLTVFVSCNSLTSIKVDKNNTVYDSRENCNAIIETKSNKLISGCNNTKIPDDVTAIEDGAFSGCADMTNIEIPNSVTVIGKHAFWGCYGLTSIEIPDSVTEIGDSAFMFCDNLKNFIWNGNTYSSYDEFKSAFEAKNGKKESEK